MGLHWDSKCQWWVYFNRTTSTANQPNDLEEKLAKEKLAMGQQIVFGRPIQSLPFGGFWPGALRAALGNTLWARYRWIWDTILCSFEPWINWLRTITDSRAAWREARPEPPYKQALARPPDGQDSMPAAVCIIHLNPNPHWFKNSNNNFLTFLRVFVILRFDCSTFSSFIAFRFSCSPLVMLYLLRLDHRLDHFGPFQSQ